jgi:Cu/Zn superoxide dismutase
MTGTSRFVQVMAVAAVVAASVAACGLSSSNSTSATPAFPIVVATLDAQPSGTVALSWDYQTKSVSAEVKMTGFTPGSRHAMHIHQGSCAAQGDVLVPFPDVAANDDGAIETTVTSSQPAPDGLAAGTLLNIHLAPAAQLGDPGSLGYTPISCTDVDPGRTALNMAPLPGQRPQGSAKLTYDPANKTLRVDVTASGLVAGSEHAEHIHIGSCDSQGAVKYPLNDLVASPAGTADASTVIQNVDQAPPASGWYLNVHLGSSSQIEENGQPTLYYQPIICGSQLTRLQRGR